MKQSVCGVVALASVCLGLTGCVTMTREVRVAAEPRATLVQQTKTPGTPQTQAASAPAAVQSERIAKLENEVIRRVNVIREQSGLPPVRRNEELTRVARSYSRLMSQQRFFSHYSPSGAGVVERVQGAGLSFQLIAENLFMSVNTPSPVSRAMQSWMQSPGHRQNILRQEVTETGVGIWKNGKTYHFTQIFMRPR